MIEGKELTLKNGDVLLLNQHVTHAIKRAEYEDIGINFIALPEFFEVPLTMVNEKNVLAEFLIGALRQKNPVSHYLLFRLKENAQVENLMENMIESMLHKHANEDIMNQYPTDYLPGKRRRKRSNRIFPLVYGDVLSAPERTGKLCV